jgi:steroid delta-isomerase-like uncharacterized protein
MTNEEAMDLLLESFEPNKRPMRLDILADDVVLVDVMLPGRPLVGKDEVAELFNAPIRDSFPDVHFIVTDTIRSEDRLVVFGDFTGTFAGDYVGFPAHGERVRWTARDVYTFRDGKIVHIDLINDTLTVARELGAKIDDPRLWDPVFTHGEPTPNAKIAV